MTLDTNELRRLRGAAAIIALHNAAPALLDAADRLARIEAVLVGDDAVEVMARAIWEKRFDPISESAPAAIAALRKLIGGV